PCSTHCRGTPRHPRALPTRRSSDLVTTLSGSPRSVASRCLANCPSVNTIEPVISAKLVHALDDLTGDVVLRLDINHRTALEHQRSEEHTPELQSRETNVCRPLLEKK